MSAAMLMMSGALGMGAAVSSSNDHGAVPPEVSEGGHTRAIQTHTEPWQY